MYVPDAEPLFENLPINRYLFLLTREAVVVKEVTVLSAEFVQPPGQVHIIPAIGDELLDLSFPVPGHRLEAVGALVGGQGGVGQGVEAQAVA